MSKNDKESWVSK